MNDLIPSLVAATLLVGMAVPTLRAEDKPDLKQPRARQSYAVGTDIGGALKRQELDVDPAALVAGISDALAGKTALTKDELDAALADFRSQMMAKMESKQSAAGDDNLKKGEEFLAANGKKDGVKTTASGLQYKVVKAADKADGKSPKATDTVKVHYHGTLLDGTVFDSSVERGEPISFPLNQVIPGWTEGVQLMKEGDKFQFYIPSKLAYGPQSPGGKIGPNSMLIFDVELLAIQ
jgi:FKBP-type peptidyl-prolyl cis-trans isomerase FklB